MNRHFSARNFPFTILFFWDIKDAKHCGDGTIDFLKKLASEQVVCAIGECGLDFDRNFSPPEVQEKWFREQVSLACELRKPLFLHERSSFKRFSEILSEFKQKLPRVCVHCFTGTRKELEYYISQGYYIGITG